MARNWTSSLAGQAGPSNRLTQAAISAANKLLYEGEMTDRPTSSVSVARWRAMVDRVYRYGPPKGAK